MSQFSKYLALMILFSGCQMLRKTKTESLESRAKSLTTTDLIDQQLFNQQLESKTIFWKRDSSDAQRLITISPKGVFKFSVDSGFIGEALELRIDEKIKQVAQLNKNVELRESLSDSTAHTLATQEKLAVANKTKSQISTPSPFPILFVAIVLACTIAFAAYRLLKTNYRTGISVKLLCLF